jgi:Thioredoxin like C-terminal domain
MAVFGRLRMPSLGGATGWLNYQLVRQHDGVGERALEIDFLESGAEAYAFTFG